MWTTKLSGSEALLKLSRTRRYDTSPSRIRGTWLGAPSRSVPAACGPKTPAKRDSRLAWASNNSSAPCGDSSTHSSPGAPMRTAELHFLITWSLICTSCDKMSAWSSGPLNIYRRKTVTVIRYLTADLKPTVVVGRGLKTGCKAASRLVHNRNIWISGIARLLESIIFISYFIKNTFEYS